MPECGSAGAIERRAIEKLIGRISTRLLEDYSESKSRPEGPDPLTPQEVEAFFGLATTWFERRVLWKVRDLIGQPPA